MKKSVNLVSVMGLEDKPGEEAAHISTANGS